MDRIGIIDHPAIVNERTRVGDWEIDLAIGKGHSGALVTRVERLTRYSVTKRIFDKLTRTVTVVRIE
ncbi:MAG: hypothetical protein KAH18_06885 [Psychromonas sp.]|nr:hypothetical protein [Psychromonas sp.]